LYPRKFYPEFAAVVFSLLGYFLTMITALAAVVTVMIGFDNLNIGKSASLSEPCIINVR
jgi:hypothetical protein